MGDGGEGRASWTDPVRDTEREWASPLIPRGTEMQDGHPGLMPRDSRAGEQPALVLRGQQGSIRRGDSSQDLSPLAVGSQAGAGVLRGSASVPVSSGSAAPWGGSRGVQRPAGAAGSCQPGLGPRPLPRPPAPGVPWPHRCCRPCRGSTWHRAGSACGAAGSPGTAGPPRRGPRPRRTPRGRSPRPRRTGKAAGHERGGGVSGADAAIPQRPPLPSSGCSFSNPRRVRSIHLRVCPFPPPSRDVPSIPEVSLTPPGVSVSP